jgi:nucleoside-diphosphate-sugar epimerase
MTSLLCFGLGYTAQHFITQHADAYERVFGTVRRSNAAPHMARPVTIIRFDGTSASPELADTVAEAEHLLVSIPPDQDGDPVLRRCRDMLATASRVAAIVYLSTVGVYGDHDGAWVDETTAPVPVAARSRARLAAEEAWRDLARQCGKPLALLRLAGIYGPGRNALLQVADASAKRIAKPGQVFNRIHVTDIAATIAAALAQRADGTFNVADDEPTAPGVPVVFAAGLLGVAPPPEVRFVDAAPAMSPMAMSFYGENKRVRNAKIKKELGVALRYPTYREGLNALFSAAGPAALNR